MNLLNEDTHSLNEDTHDEVIQRMAPSGNYWPFR